jgi:uncharacterized protein YbjQ (UPF0145 family)
MSNIKCPQCGLVNFESAEVCKRCSLNLKQLREEAEREELARREQRELHPQHRQILLSTGEVQYQYRVIDVVFAYGNSSQSFFKDANPMEAYQRVSVMLEQAAAQIGANAVLWVKYDYRVALTQGLIGPNQVFEVFAYGTAVKLL